MPVQIVTVGDNVVDCYPDLGLMYPGGNTVNVAVHLSRLGVPVGYVGAIGSDTAGAVVFDALAREGVDCSHVRREPGVNARACVRLDHGNRVFVGANPGVSVFSVSTQDLGWMAEARLVHTGECSSLEEQLPELQQLPGLLSYDFSVRPLDYVADHAPRVDVAILSFERTHAATPVELAERVLGMGPRVVAVTDGHRGAVVASRGGVVTATAPDVEVVDTLGAGDAFIARFLTGLVAGEALQSLAEASTAYASATCTEYGAFGYEAPLPEEIAQSSEWQSASSELPVGSITVRESG